MTWYVKKRGIDGKIAAVLVDDWNKAMETRSEFETKGCVAWIEDRDGKRFGFAEITPAAKKS